MKEEESRSAFSSYSQARAWFYAEECEVQERCFCKFKTARHAAATVDYCATSGWHVQWSTVNPERAAIWTWHISVHTYFQM